VERERYIAEARERALLLYEGRVTPHRSCGIAVAETFGLPTASYQALRRGGLTGEGTCGALLGGILVLGEILGDPDPTGAPTPLLRQAIPLYRSRIATRLQDSPERSCNSRVAAFPDFMSSERRSYCTNLALTVAEVVAEVLWELEQPRPLPDWSPGS
jgi:hypothetical protein